MDQQKKSGRFIAIATMFALYAMCGFMTYLAAPAGKIWGGCSGIAGSTTLGMMGNMMNFLAYLVLGYPVGLVLQKCGYKATALLACGSGAAGILVQLLSGHVDLGVAGGVPAAWYIYLLGAFISGASNCLLNAVINPMLNQIAGGGKKGNQLNLAGGACNSMFQGLSMLVVPMVVGEVTAQTKFADVTGVLLAAAAVFVVATVVIACLPIRNPTQRAANVVYERSALAFRHCLLGVIGIFLYMGVEAGIPAATSSTQIKDLMGGGDTAAVMAGSLGMAVFVCMLLGRMLGAAFGGRIAPRTMLLAATGVSLALLALGTGLIAAGVSLPLAVPGGAAGASATVNVPVGAFCFVLMGFCTSVMWSVIFNLSTEGLGKYTEQAAGFFMMMVVGGGVLPLVQSYITDKVGFVISFIVPAACLAYLFVYALAFSKNVNTGIKVD